MQVSPSDPAVLPKNSWLSSGKKPSCTAAPLCHKRPASRRSASGVATVTASAAEVAAVVAAVVARRHSGRDVTTACVDTLEFAAPAHVNDTILIIGRMTYVGRTSMEVRVETYTENREGMRRRINRAYFVLVAIDDEENPVEVPRLALETDEDRLEWENGKKRRELRRKRRAEHY